MPWSGGTYTKGNAGTGGWTGDAGLGIGIEAGRHDTQDNDFANGINNALTKDGQNTPTANLPMGGYKHTGVGDATAASEYVSYGQLLDVTKAVTTTGTAPAYEVTLTPAPAAYFDGMTFVVMFHSVLAVSTGATLNVNGLGARDIKIPGASAGYRDPYTGELGTDAPYVVCYSSSTGDFHLISPTHSAETFTPSIGSASGSTTLNSSTCTFSFFANKILVSYALNIGLTGSTSSYVTASLPFARAASFDEMPLAAWMGSVTGATDKNCNAIMSTSGTVYFYRGDSLSNWPIDNFTINAMGVYQASF
jgi:hypothetical protein